MKDKDILSFNGSFEDIKKVHETDAARLELIQE